MQLQKGFESTESQFAW